MENQIKQNNIHDELSLQSCFQNKAENDSTDKYVINININSSDLISQIDSKLTHTSYKAFMEKWIERKNYPLPDCFKFISLVDLSAEQLDKEYQDFDFNVLSYTGKQLCQAATKIIMSNGFDAVCRQNQIKILVQQICLRYNIVSYHNFSHGFSLLHMLYQLTKIDINFKQLFTVQEIGYILIAALAHDVNHPGTNNGFEVKIKSDKALDAKNQSVLEKMHTKQLFNLLRQKKLDIFQKSKNGLKMKQLMIQVILSTDISKHFKNLQKLKQMNNSKQIDKIHNNKHFYIEQVFHACDIGNPCLQFQSYMNWACLLSYQFNTQTLLQAQQKVQITQMLKYKTLTGFYSGQINFINSLVVPLWKQLVYVWPSFNKLTENIEKNIKYLQDKIEDLDQMDQVKN